MKKIFLYLSIILLAFLSAFNYSVFIFPNHFAPAGIDGIFTMLQDITQLNMGYFSLLANIPLLIVAFFVLNRAFSLRTTIYVLTFSLSIIFMKHIGISAFGYQTNTGTSIILAPIAAGVIRGILYALTLKLNASSSGVDIIAALVKHKKPHLDLMHVIFIFNVFVALSSYFVYGFKPEPVICSMLYTFITSSVSSHLRSTKNKTVKYEIITQDAETLCADITSKLHLTATILHANGAYSGTNTNIVLCVVPQNKAPFFEDFLLQHPESIVFKSEVNRTLLGVSYK